MIIAPSALAAEEAFQDGVREELEISARYVVSSAAARQTFRKLVGADKLPAKFMTMLGRLEPTPTFCALFLGLNMDLRQMRFVPVLHIHSSGYDTDAHFQNVREKLLSSDGPAPFFRLQLAPKRLAQKTPVENLLLAGQWTAPAVGVMSTVVSGLQAARAVLRREGVREPLADIGIEKGLMV